MSEHGPSKSDFLLAIGLISLSLFALLQIGTDHTQDKQIEHLQREVATLRAGVEKAK